VSMTEVRVTEDTRTRLWPHSSGGWWAVGLSAATLACWLAVPITTVVTRVPGAEDFVPWVLVGVAALVNAVAIVVDLLCLRRRWDQSILNVLAAVGTVGLALLIIAMVVGEGLTGV
jgi:hypothetical protein